MKFNLVLAIAASLFSGTVFGSSFRDYVGSYKVTSVTCGDTNGVQKVCSSNNKASLNIVMIEQTPCVQFGENGGWSMQYCMNAAAGVSGAEAKYDSQDIHGTLRYNMEMKSEGGNLSFVWRVYDNPTYQRSSSLKPMDGTSIYKLQKN